MYANSPDMCAFNPEEKNVSDGLHENDVLGHYSPCHPNQILNADNANLMPISVSSTPPEGKWVNHYMTNNANSGTPIQSLSYDNLNSHSVCHNNGQLNSNVHFGVPNDNNLLQNFSSESPQVSFRKRVEQKQHTPLHIVPQHFLPHHTLPQHIGTLLPGIHNVSPYPIGQPYSYMVQVTPVPSQTFHQLNPHDTWPVRTSNVPPVRFSLGRGSAQDRQLIHQRCNSFRKAHLKSPSQKRSEKIIPSISPKHYTSRRNSGFKMPHRSSNEFSTPENRHCKVLRFSASPPSSTIDSGRRSRTSSFCSNASDESDLLSENSFISEKCSWATQENVVTEVQPKLKSYQLIGDSLLLRFAEQILYQRAEYGFGARFNGFCVSGQKITDLLERVEKRWGPVGDKVVLLIGTNDILQNTDVLHMHQTLKLLLLELSKEAKKIVLLTIPPIPKLQLRKEHWDRIECYNTFIKTLQDQTITVADISTLFISERKAAIMECFETYYHHGNRVDLIHLNRKGLEMIDTFLAKFLT